MDGNAVDVVFYIYGSRSLFFRTRSEVSVLEMYEGLVSSVGVNAVNWLEILRSAYHIHIFASVFDYECKDMTGL